MADYRAITAVTEAIVNLLRVNYREENFNNELEFKVFTSKDFSANVLQNGASLFPYRIYTNGTHRIPSGRIASDGRPLRTALPVELHFLITVWGREASLQNSLAGWIMRTLEDTPTLPAGILNSVVSDAFRPDETVDISLAELRTEDMFRIWDVIGMNVYQLSLPYVARFIHLESRLPEHFDSGRVVQRRQNDMALME
jgi:hypothetical protein